MSKLPIRWTPAELQADVETAKSIFRHERVGEPLDLYKQFFTTFSAIFADTIDKLPDVAANPVDSKLLAALVKGKNQKKAFRYLTAPPISEDDLKAVADTSIGPVVFKKDADAAKRVRDTVLSILDPYRFPWVAQGRSPTAIERESAIVASAALAAAREVETKRRNTSKDVQEKAVKDLLASIGMKEVAARNIPILTDAPAPGEFCGESALAGKRADVVARLRDGRVLAIECKVSNSSVNSYKRVVHDTGGKAAHWYQQLGRAQVIPCGVLAGVYAPANLTLVQEKGDVYLYWQHRLSDLADFAN
jgi:hypothetical protein